MKKADVGKKIFLGSVPTYSDFQNNFNLDINCNVVIEQALVFGV